MEKNINQTLSSDRNSLRYAFMYDKNITASTNAHPKPNYYRNSNTSMTSGIYNKYRSTKRNITRDYLSIWVPVSWKNREKYIDDYFDSVVNTENYIFGKIHKKDKLPYNLREK